MNPIFTKAIAGIFNDPQKLNEMINSVKKNPELAEQTEKLIFDLFVEQFKGMTEKEQFGLSRIFNEQTGGKLSPYNSPSPVAVGVIHIVDENGRNGLLGCRRAIAPKIGEIALPGGFVNTNEDPRLAVLREVFEETGLKLSVDMLEEASQNFMGHGNNMLMFYSNDYKNPLEVNLAKLQENILEVSNGETSEIIFIDEKVELCFPLHQHMANKGLEKIGLTPQFNVELSSSNTNKFKP